MFKNNRVLFFFKLVRFPWTTLYVETERSKNWLGSRSAATEPWVHNSNDRTMQVFSDQMCHTEKRQRNFPSALTTSTAQQLRLWLCGAWLDELDTSRDSRRSLLQILWDRGRDLIDCGYGQGNVLNNRAVFIRSVWFLVSTIKGG